MAAGRSDMRTTATIPKNINNFLSGTWPPSEVSDVYRLLIRNWDEEYNIKTRHGPCVGNHGGFFPYRAGQVSILPIPNRY